MINLARNRGVGLNRSTSFLLEGTMRSFINDLMTLPDAASRFGYLLQGIAVAIGILLVIASYVHLSDPVARDGYTTFIGVLLGGQSIVTVAKGYNKVAEAKATKADTEAVKADTANKEAETK